RRVLDRQRKLLGDNFGHLDEPGRKGVLTVRFEVQDPPEAVAGDDRDTQLRLSVPSLSRDVAWVGAHILHNDGFTGASGAADQPHRDRQDRRVYEWAAAFDHTRI